MTERHAITRVRHELRRRTLTVTATQRLSANFVRITLAGDDLAGFRSEGHDDHVKLFFPVAGQDPQMRDFTPRRYDANAGELTIDFALHEAGPATDWAANAVVDQTLDVGGPRGSFVVADDFDWYLLVGDETAMPAIARRLEELRPEAKAITVIAVSGPDAELAFQSRATLDLHWVHRPLSQATDPAPVLAAVAALTLPTGDGYVWIAGESAMAKTIRQHLVAERGHNPRWIKAAGYWRSGAIGVHDKHED